MTREEFYPGFAKTRSFYEREFPPNSKKHWPYDPEPDERDYLEWLKEVVDPSTEEFYKNKIGDSPKYLIKQIVRVRVAEGEEYLYSRGEIKGYKMHGETKATNCDKPESYLYTEFTHETLRDERDGHDKRFTTGINEKVRKYELPFSAESVDILWAKRDPKGCTLTLKDERTGANPQSCDSLEMFKTKQFDYIMNAEWQSPEQREIAMKESEILLGKSHKK